MPSATELEAVAPGIWLWRNYDPSVKAELFSTAIRTANGVALVDPIALVPAASAELSGLSRMSGIVVTNENHVRAAADFAKQLSIPVLAHSETFSSADKTEVQHLADNDRIFGDCEVMTIEGAPAGEIALYHPGNGGTLIVGDALIHFEPYGFTFLPAKYCVNANQMRASLRKLLRHDFERIFFAHGLPIMSNGKATLQSLLDS